MKKKLTAKQYLFERYKKYFPKAKSFNDIKDEILYLSKVAELIEDYQKQK